MILKKLSKTNSSECGAALAVVVLIMFVLMSVGIYAIQTSRSELLITMNQIYGQQAEYVAEAGIQMVSSLLTRSTNMVNVLIQKSGMDTDPEPCQHSQNLCFSAAAFFPKNTSSPLSNQAFRLDSFIPHPCSRSPLIPCNLYPSIYGDFQVRIHNPIKSSVSLAGYSVHSLTSCTFTVTLTSTGWIRNFNQSNRILGEKRLRAFLQVQATGTSCN